MAKTRDHRSKGRHRDGGDHHHRGDGDDDRYEGEREPYDDPGEHLDIEHARFRGGLEPTPQRYARGREQWYRLPGAVVRSSMDPAIDDPDGK